MAASGTLRVEARPVQRALGRSALYRFLSLGCAYPSPSALAALREEALPLARLAAEVVAPEVGRHLTSLAEELVRTDLEGLRREYHRVFTHSTAADCPAYESAYTARHLFQQAQAMGDVAGFYRAFGFQASADNRERVDHIGVELEFMHLLAYKEAYALVHHGRGKVRLCRRAQRRFWGDHLGRWLPLFAALLAGRAGDGFYGRLALAADAFARAEARELGDVLTAGATVDQPGADFGCLLADDGCPAAGGETGGEAL